MAISKRALSTAVVMLMLFMVTACGKTSTWEEVHQEAMDLYKKQNYDAAIMTEKRALVIAHHDGPNLVKVASSLFSLASYNHLKGQDDEAESFYKQSIMVLDRTKSPKVGVFIGDLAQFYIDKERYAEAEPWLERYISLSEQENNKIAMATGLEAMSIVYKQTGRLFQSTYAQERAAKLREQ